MEQRLNTPTSVQRRLRFYTYYLPTYLPLFVVCLEILFPSRSSPSQKDDGIKERMKYRAKEIPRRHARPMRYASVAVRSFSVLSVNGDRARLRREISSLREENKTEIRRR